MSKKNEKTIVFISDATEFYRESLMYSLKSPIICNIDKKTNDISCDCLADELNNDKNLKNIYFLGYNYKFYVLLPMISKNKKTSWIFEYSISNFSTPYIFSYFKQIMEYYSRNLLSKVICINYDLYITFKERYNFSFIKFDFSFIKENLKQCIRKTNSIGIIGYDYIDTNNFYNCLSAISLSSFNNVNLVNEMKVTKNFSCDFHLKTKKCKDFNQVILDSDIILYCSFCGINDLLILKSMDSGIPCIVGNTSIFDKYPVLKNNLVLNQDDNIDEIKIKIDNVIKNKEIIMLEYCKFREEYSKECLQILNKIN